MFGRGICEKIPVERRTISRVDCFLELSRQYITTKANLPKSISLDSVRLIRQNSISPLVGQITKYQKPLLVYFDMYCKPTTAE